MTRRILLLLFGLALFAQTSLPPQIKQVPSWAPPGWPKEAIIWGLSDRIKEQLKVQVPHLIHWQYQWNKDSLGLRREPIKAWEHYEAFPKGKPICIEVVTDERKLYAYSMDLGIGMSFTKYTHGLGRSEVWFIDPKNIKKDLDTWYQQAVRSYQMRESTGQPHLADADIHKLMRYSFWISIGEFEDGRSTMGTNHTQMRMLQMILDNKDVSVGPTEYIEVVVPAFSEYDDAIYVWAKYHGDERPAKFVFTRHWNDDPDDLSLSNDLRGFNDEQAKSRHWQMIFRHAYKHLLVAPDGRIYDLPTDGVEVKPVAWPKEDQKLIEEWSKKDGVKPLKPSAYIGH